MLRTLALATLAAWALLPVAGSAPLYARILTGEDYPLLVFTLGSQASALVAALIALALTLRSPGRPDARALAWTLAFFALASTSLYPAYFSPPVRAELMEMPIVGTAVGALHELALGLACLGFVRFAVLFPRPLPPDELARVTSDGLTASRGSWERAFGPVDAAFYRLARAIGLRDLHDGSSPVLVPRDAARLARFVEWARSAGPVRLAWGTALAVLTLEVLPWSGWTGSIAGVLVLVFTSVFLLACIPGVLVLRLAHAAGDAEARGRGGWILEAVFSFLWVTAALIPVSVGLWLFDAPAALRDAVNSAFAPAVALWALACAAAAVARGAFASPATPP